MKNLDTKKELEDKINSIFNTGDETTKILAVRELGSDAICKILVKNNYIYGYELMLKRLKNEANIEEMTKIYKQLSKVKNGEMRKLVAKDAPIEIICEMATTEDDLDIVKVIIERLEKQKDTQVVKNSYAKLSKAKSIKIREFVFSIMPIEMLKQIVEAGEDRCILRLISEINKIS